MNGKLITGLVGRVLRTEGILLFLPGIVGLIYQEWRSALIFGVLAVCLILLSIPLVRIGAKNERKRMQMKEGFVIVAMSWILASFFGCLPFFFSGSFDGLIDSFFEAVSGFTTTGSTILRNVETLDKSMLFWRSFTHWIGGMGILVFILGLMPNLGGSSVQLMKAESPGVAPGKLVPRLSESSRILYGIYMALTVALILLLLLTGMPLFDSIVHAMGTAGTGGFSIKNASIGAYNSVSAEVIIAVFMLLFGVNFNIYYYLLKKQWDDVKGNGELKVYGAIILISVILIVVDIMPQVGSFWESVRLAFFNVSTIITTTGYGTADFNLWPTFSKLILVGLMLVGACGGSTGGGMKVGRIVILCRAAGREASQIVHPNMVKSIKTDGRVIEDKTVREVLVFFFIYMLIIVGAALLVSLDGFDAESSVTAVIAAISNIGPGLGVVGPAGNFADFSGISKLILSFCMLAGRLELFPMLVLMSPSSWKKDF